MNAIIVEDSKTSSELLYGLLREYIPEIKVLGLATDIESAILLIYEKKPDLVFLDIELKTGTAFDLLNHLKKIDFEIIFISGFNQYAIEAFQFNAIHYLVKPITAPELLEAVNRIEKVKKQNNSEKSYTLKNDIDRKIMISTEHDMRFVRTKDIKYVKADGSYSIIYLSSNQKIVISKLLKEIEKQLHSEEFYRVSKSYIINLNHIARIKHIDGGLIEMIDGVDILIPRRKRNEFTLQIMKFLS